MNTQVSAALDNQDAVRVRRVDHAARVPGQAQHARFAVALGPSITVTMGFAQLLELAAELHARIEEIAPSGAGAKLTLANAAAMHGRVAPVLRAVAPEAGEACTRDEDNAAKGAAPLACQPTCTVCGRSKAPEFRDVPPALAESLCLSDCPGYFQPPRANSLWREEEAAEAAGAAVREDEDVSDEANYGHCDECGSPCDSDGCTKDTAHQIANVLTAPPLRARDTR